MKRRKTDEFRKNKMMSDEEEEVSRSKEEALTGKRKEKTR